jgi:hypothetical protein
VRFQRKIILFMILFLTLSKFLLESLPSPSKTNKHNSAMQLYHNLASTNNLGSASPLQRGM